MNGVTNNVAVIGGGAAGITAAISAAMHGASVTVYESGDRIGRKILATGNGRCNMTNINAGTEHYHGADAKFIEGAKARFWIEETLNFFSELGVLSKTDTEGRVYPYSDQASAVLDVLRFKMDVLGVNVVYSFEVKSVENKSGCFCITSYDGRSGSADKVIVATGGKAAPDLGSKGMGYELLKSFGHTISDLRPSLVQIKTEADIVRKLKGIRLNAAVSIDGHSEQGEILFTDYGLSGIAVFSTTAYLENQKTIALDLMSQYTEHQLYDMICRRVLQNPDIALENFLVGMLNKRVAQVILKQIGIAPLSRKAVTLSGDEIKRLCGIIKCWEFKIEGTMSWNNAQVTKGGALTCEFDNSTMQSKKQRGLYAAGEILDIDGDCGGYNLQWAWSSGYLAGKSSAEE